MDKELFHKRRSSYMETGEIYFWTATINGWKRLLRKNTFKDTIISSLDFLSREAIMDVFGFTIMPNHVHLIWRANKRNKKETGPSSFLKFTAHEFRKILHRENSEELQYYRVEANNKKHEFWQRDPMAIHLYSKKVAYQKLDYMHNNPLAARWQLVNDACDYEYSSARFYELGERNFDFIKDLREEF